MDELAERLGLDPVELRRINEPDVDPVSGDPIMVEGRGNALMHFQGMDPAQGVPRFTFDSMELMEGIGFVPVIMGLFGIIIASVVNIFLKAEMLQFIISIVGVLVFAGLTAYDTQRLKSEYLYGAMEGDGYERSAILGALSLYLNFINLFTLLLQLLGQRDE